MPILFSSFYFSKQLILKPGIALILLISFFLSVILEFIFGSLAFIFTKTGTFKTLIMTILSLVGGVIIPINLYPEWMKNISRFSPTYAIYGAIADYASNNISLNQVLLLQLCWIILFNFLFYFLWKYGSNKYESIN